MVFQVRKMNLDDIALPYCARDSPLDPAVCEQNIGGATEELSTGMKNMDECLEKTNDASPSSPTACSIVSDVVEHVEPLGDKSHLPPSTKDTTLDDTLCKTTQKSNGMYV